MFKKFFELMSRTISKVISLINMANAKRAVDTSSYDLLSVREKDGKIFIDLNKN